jgi:sporulation protein YlmC with PRC-barrel domain
MRPTVLLVAALAFVGQARAEGFYAHLFEPGTLRVDEVIGMEVITREGKTLGRIHDVLFDRASGSIDSIALDGAGQRYSVSSLLSSDLPGKVIVEPPVDFASAGASGLLSAPSAQSLSSARGEALLIDLRDGRVRPIR